MTEKEIIETLEIEKAYMDSYAGRSQSEALKYAIEAVQEIQQYRAIGTVEQLEWCKDASHWKELFKEKLEKYEAIGTIEEFKALKEKSVAKKVVVEHIPKTSWTKEISHYLCPSCRSIFSFGGKPYCSNCGQKVDF